MSQKLRRSHATDPEDTIKLLCQIGKDAYRYTVSVGSYLRVLLLAIGITARTAYREPMVLLYRILVNVRR